ncbi:unnamed protein product [Cochlearia groenlandica]
MAASCVGESASKIKNLEMNKKEEVEIYIDFKSVGSDRNSENSGRETPANETLRRGTRRRKRAFGYGGIVNIFTSPN